MLTTIRSAFCILIYLLWRIFYFLSCIWTLHKFIFLFSHSYRSKPITVINILRSITSMSFQIYIFTFILRRVFILKIFLPWWIWFTLSQVFRSIIAGTITTAWEHRHLYLLIVHLIICIVIWTFFIIILVSDVCIFLLEIALLFLQTKHRFPKTRPILWHYQFWIWGLLWNIFFVATASIIFNIIFKFSYFFEEIDWCHYEYKYH